MRAGRGWLGGGRVDFLWWSAVVGASVMFAALAAATALRWFGRLSPAARAASAVILCEAMLLGGVAGAALFTADFDPERLTEDPGAAWTIGLFLLGHFHAGFAYLMLLRTLPTSLVRPLRPRPVRTALLFGGTAWLALFLGLAWSGSPTAGLVAALNAAFLIGVTTIYGIAAALHAWWKSPRGSSQRRQARAFATAFGVRDVFWLGFLPLAFPDLGLTLLYLSLALVLYVSLLAYSILRDRLFDIDVRVQRGLARTIFLAFFIAAFFVAEQVGQELISEAAGPYLGLVGAGMLAVALVPVRRLAHRIAGLALPKQEASADEISHRKRDVYRTLLKDTLEDGEITPRERKILYHLAGELGLSAQEIAAIELEVGPRPAAPPAGLTEGTPQSGA